MSQIPITFNSHEEPAATSTFLDELDMGGTVPAGQVVTNMTLKSLLAMLRLLLDSTGIVKVETPHLSWKIFIYGGSIAMIEEKNEFLPTLLRKFKIQKIRASDQVELTKKQNNSYQLYQLISQIFEQDPESTRQALKEVLFENLLALYLENTFSFVWQPAPTNTHFTLPIWQFSVLEDAATRGVQQWKKFSYVNHPYQTVQLLDEDHTIAHVPLFAKVTKGAHRISEIADHFKQHVSRTALKLDKLAENRTVAILPLQARSLVPEESNLPLTNDEIEIPRVLIVDDSPVLLKQFGELLKSWGYKINLVSEAANATQKILEYKPSIVFMDINMPEINGFDLIKQIRRQSNLSSIPLVLVTAENNMANNFRAKWAHCRFLAKPRTSAETQEFREQLRALLRELAPLPTDPIV
ncbi:response regulator [Tumidithrix elongata RA019]|uniref:Response regulator n=1 Tax=Tumidithrix elongata BACA0141 TaxID=2716417 RepID=A0AAW9PR53_9CYAN|nr:response regulator [Tumidithrix elongata RA019]